MAVRGRTGKDMPAAPGGGVRVLTTKAAPREDLCILVENGIPCANRRQSRGLCNRHLQYLRAQHRLAEFALPRQTPSDRKHTFQVKTNPDPAVCRVIVNGKPCSSPAERRGLCTKHYQSIWQRPDLKLDDFCAPASEQRRIRLRRRIPKGVCRVRESGKDCLEPVHARGLCKNHYRWLRENDSSLFEQIAEPDPKAKRYTLRSRPKEGRCRVAVNGRGCPRPAKIRGLCQHCYNVLRQKPDLLAQIALPPTEVTARRFESKADVTKAPVQCVILENGVPCTRPPEHRGVCGYHRKLIGGHRGHSLADFYLPESAPVLSAKPKEETADGLCRAVEDARPCAKAPYARGLCRRHYRMASEQGVLDALAAPTRNGRTRFGAGNDRPHFYLDKNVLFDYADSAFFDSSGQAGSVELVKRVLAGEARASISTDAVKSTYNHVRHRLTRPATEGGRELPEDQAEALAHEFVEKTFYGGGAWRIVSLDAVMFGKMVVSEEELSLEDALEFQAYQLTRAGKAGPTMFITRDEDFPEGVHPIRVAQEFRWL